MQQQQSKHTNESVTRLREQTQQQQDQQQHYELGIICVRDYL